jgi:hydrophobic/amphiphilic exporter-1 (mainly G- bacteria), HAE1 family
MRITSLAVSRPVSLGVITLAVVVLGIYGLTRLPVDLLPDITYPLVRVEVQWRGSTPEEIITNLAEPIERQVATVDGLDYLSSRSIEGRYSLEVSFRYGVDVNIAYQDVLAAMSRAAPHLPPDIETPIVFKADPSQLPVVLLVLSSDQWDMVQLRSWAERWLADQVVAVPGVAGTEVAGGLKREIRVHLDPAALEKYGLSLNTVLRRLQEENIQQFGGRVTAGPQEFIARTSGEFQSLEEIRSVLIARDGLAKVHLRDIATVHDLHEPARIITRFNGAPGVRLSVLKQADANTVEVVRGVEAKVRELESAIPSHVQIGMMENQAEYVEAALAGVRNVAVLAAVMVILVVYLFLGSWRQVLVMLLILPATLIINFALMKLAGFSLNIFSLGGLVIAIGVVLDNSTIVLENITRLRREKPDAPVRQTSVEGAHQVGPAVVAATLSYMALFVPFLLVPGLASLLLRELVLVIGGIVLISLLVALTLTPALASGLLGRQDPLRRQTRFERFFAAVTSGYGQLLSPALRARWGIVAGFLLVTLVGGWLLPRLGFEFLPRMDDGRVRVQVRLPTGASVEQTDLIVQQVEAQLVSGPEVESVFALSGGRTRGLFTTEVANEGEINVQLKPRGVRTLTTEEYIGQTRPAAARINVPGGAVMVRPAQMRGIRAGAGGDSDIVLMLQGPDITMLFELAGRTADAMRELPQLAHINVSIDLSKPEYQVLIDRTRAADLGVSVGDVSDSLRTLIAGAVPTQYRDGGEYYDVRVLIPEPLLASRQDVENLVLATPSGDPIRVAEVAEVRTATGPVEIVRENQTNVVTVTGDIARGSVGEAMAEVESAVASVGLPVGYGHSFGGQAQQTLEMRRTMLVIVAFAVFFAFVILAVQFDSLKLPGLILLTLPVSLAGMVLILAAVGLPLGATVFIGVLIVVAATVNDGVLLLTFAEHIRAERQVTPAAAVVEAAMVRLRPRVMTTVSVIAGLTPLALKLDEGGDMLYPMAVAAIGGLGLEMLVALFLMPTLYVIVTREKVRQPRWHTDSPVAALST